VRDRSIFDSPESRELMITNPPSGRATTVTKLQTGTPLSMRPDGPLGRPARSNTCQTSEPPFCQPVPSVHTRIASPWASPATAGCLRSPRPRDRPAYRETPGLQNPHVASYVEGD
jgi:hypothetical protein